MKSKLLIILALLLLLLAGCNLSNTNSKNTSAKKVSSFEVYPFNNLILKEQVKNLAFQSKLPTKMPFENVKASSSSLPDQRDMQTFDFYTKNEGYLELLVVKGKTSNSEIKSKEVQIGDIKGQFVSTKENALLRWKEKDLEYTLSYFPEKSKTKLSEEELIEMAKSFK